MTDWIEFSVGWDPKRIVLTLDSRGLVLVGYYSDTYPVRARLGTVQR